MTSDIDPKALALRVAETCDRISVEAPDDVYLSVSLYGPEAATVLAERDATIERLTNMVYVPGLWKCPKCKFSLLQANLNASDGTVTARDQPGDKCPNCASPLWRVTERDAGNEMVDRAEEYLARATTAERERDEARAEVERKDVALKRLLDACPEEHGCFPRSRCQSEHEQTDDNELKAAIADARSALSAGGENGG